MDRRNFIKTASSFVLPITLDGMQMSAFTPNSALLQSLLSTNFINEDRVLIMINLNGGNDGLNTVIPKDQLSLYNGLRSNIAIPENLILPLNNTPETGLHPVMTGMKQLYDENKLAIIHSVSYPNPNYSHYQANQIWMTASPSDSSANSGWLGRYLDTRYPGYPNSYPNPTMEDPLAIQIDYLTSTVMMGSQQAMSININNPDQFAQLVGSSIVTSPNDLPCCEAGNLIAFVRQQQILSIGYAGEIKAASDAGVNTAVYPSSNKLGEQLKIIARLIHGGLKTKVFMVTQYGYDTHAGQIGTDTITGQHANLLKELSDAITTFQRDLELQGIADKVIGMTYSEFGRRANSNNSRGTDHGVAAPLFVFGTNIKRRVVGYNPNLSDLDNYFGGSNYDLKMQIDFRRVYRDILRGWFGVNHTSSANLLYENFTTVSLFSNVVESIKSGKWLEPQTWSTGRIPARSDDVLINTGHKVSVLSGELAECNLITINGQFDAQLGCVFRSR